jgi:hypothetical protein
MTRELGRPAARAAPLGRPIRLTSGRPSRLPRLSWRSALPRLEAMVGRADEPMRLRAFVVVGTQDEAGDFAL